MDTSKEEVGADSEEVVGTIKDVQEDKDEGDLQPSGPASTQISHAPTPPPEVQTPKPSKRELIKQELIDCIKTHIKDYEAYELNKFDKKTNAHVYYAPNLLKSAGSEGTGVGVSFIVTERLGVKPADFLTIFERLPEMKWNQFSKFCKPLWVQDGVQAFHTEINSVFPTSNRVFFDFRYMGELEDGSTYAILSS